METALNSDPVLYYHLGVGPMRRCALARGDENLAVDFNRELCGEFYTRLQNTHGLWEKGPVLFSPGRVLSHTRPQRDVVRGDEDTKMGSGEESFAHALVVCRQSRLFRPDCFCPHPGYPRMLEGGLLARVSSDVGDDARAIIGLTQGTPG